MLKKTIHVLFYVIAAFYAFIMIDLFFRFNYIFEAGREISRSYNLIPFQTIWDYASGNTNVSLSNAVSNILWNIVVFIPYGLFLQVMRKRKTFAKNVLIVIITAVAIELIQFIFGLGASDIDDVILNSCGGVIGILLYQLLNKICKDERRTKTLITIISLVIGIPVIYWYFTTVFNHMRL